MESINKDNIEERFKELVGYYLYNEITNEEEIELTKIISNSSELQNRFEEYKKLNNIIKNNKDVLEEVQNNYVSNQSNGRLLKFPTKKTISVLSLAAILLFSVTLTWISQNKQEKSEIVKIEFLGDCYGNSTLPKQLQKEISINQGNTNDCKLKLTSSNNQVFAKVYPNTKILVQQKNQNSEKLSIYLETGKLLLSENTKIENSRMEIFSNGKKIQFLGTSILISTEVEKTSVKVLEGSVEVTTDVEKIEEDIDPKMKNQVLSYVKQNSFLISTNEEAIYRPSQKINMENLPITEEKIKEVFSKDTSLISKNSIQIDEKEFIDYKEEKTSLESWNSTVIPTEKIRNIQPTKKDEQKSDIPKALSDEESEKYNKDNEVDLGDKKVILKNGTILEGSLKQSGNIYLIKTKKDKKSYVLKKDQISSIEFQSN